MSKRSSRSLRAFTAALSVTASLASTSMAVMAHAQDAVQPPPAPALEPAPSTEAAPATEAAPMPAPAPAPAPAPVPAPAPATSAPLAPPVGTALPYDEMELEPSGRRGRVLTFVPRVGAQLGTWGGALSLRAEIFGEELEDDADVSGGAGFVAGAELLFRIGSVFRLGAGVLVMPSVSVDLDEPLATEDELMLGTLVRVPFVVEWAIPVSDSVDLVPGVVPALGFLVRGERAERFARDLCQDCADDPAIGVSVDGQLGTIVHVGKLGVRADLRYGLEVVNIASDNEGGDELDVSLVGTRMQLLAGVEL